MFSLTSLFHEIGSKVLLVAIMVTITTFMLTAQEKFEVVHYDVKDGLSHTHVTSVLEHSGGFVWIGSKDGIDRFDGYEFVKVDLPKHPNLMFGSVGPFILSMKELEDGKIYMDFVQNTNKKHKVIYIFDPTTYVTEISNTKSLGSLSFRSCKNQEKTPSKRSIEYLGSDCNGNTIVKDLISSSIYLSYSDGKQVELSDHFINEDFQISFMGNDFSNIIYAKSTNGILKITPVANPFHNFINEEINDWDFGPRARAICSINDAEILVSIEDDDLKKVNLNTKIVQDLIFRDALTDTLISTHYLTGILKESDSIFYATSLENNFLRLNINNLKAEPILHDGKHISYLHHHTIRLKNGQILIAGTDKSFALYLYDPRHAALDTFDIGKPYIEGTVHSCYILESNDVNLWVGTDYGLLHVDIYSKKVLSSYIKKDTDNRTSPRPLHEYPLLSGKGVISLYEEEEGLLWVGLDKGGLDVLDPHKKAIKNFNMEDGLSGSTVAGIVEHNGNIWLSTYTGLSVMNTTNGSISTFYKKDGLPHEEFNRLSMAKTSEGKIVFGGMNGVTCFNPDEIVNKNEKIKIGLSQISYYNSDGRTLVSESRTTEGAVDVSIPAGNRACSFKYFLNDFKDPEASTYEYQLVSDSRFGTDHRGEWKNNGNRNEIKFDHLESGDYKLYVRGKTSKGAMSNAYVLNLNVKDYFYNRSWFKLLVMGLFSGFIYTLYKLKLNQVRNIENVRTKLSSDLHDNVGSLLSGVAYQMELLEYSVDETQKSLVQNVARSSRKAMSQMRDVVWALDSRNSNYQNLADRFSEHADELLSPLNILFSLKMDETILKKEIDPKKKHELLSIFQEFLANTIKHSDATQVEIGMMLAGDRVHFSLKDNGTGLETTGLNHSGQGLNNMKLRTQKINGRFSIDTCSGFNIDIEFPLKK